MLKRFRHIRVGIIKLIQNIFSLKFNRIIPNTEPRKYLNSISIVFDVSLHEYTNSYKYRK